MQEWVSGSTRPYSRPDAYQIFLAKWAWETHNKSSRPRIMVNSGSHRYENCSRDPIGLHNICLLGLEKPLSMPRTQMSFSEFRDWTHKRFFAPKILFLQKTFSKTPFNKKHCITALTGHGTAFSPNLNLRRLSYKFSMRHFYIHLINHRIMHGRIYLLMSQ